MVDLKPPWLVSIEADLGQEEIPGPANNPRIIAKARLPGVKFPEVDGLVAYGNQYASDDKQAWCGAETGGSLAEVGLMPPFGPTPTDRYFWAASYRTYGVPCDMRRGAIACYDGHVNVVDEVIDADTFWGVGGNQGSPNGGAVTRSKRKRSSVITFRWPSDEGLAKANLSQWSLSAKPGAAQTTTVRPLISRKLASTGGFVTEAQKILGVAPSGIFDDATDAAVRAFQRQRGLDVDGEIGTDTWRALLGGANITIAGDVPHAAEYLADWVAMVIDPAHVAEVDNFARQALANKARYRAAVAGTSVPWWFVAGCHYRESTFDFTRNIHNGQPLGQVTTEEPLHRGPFATFEASVRDWIALKALDKVVWSLAQAAYRFELNNGPGYRNHGVPSAYLWSFCSIYIGGKFPRDHVFDPAMKDKQCGTMPLLRALMALDPSITFDDDPNRKPVMPETPALPSPEILPPPNQTKAKVDLGEVIGNALKSAIITKITSNPGQLDALIIQLLGGTMPPTDKPATPVTQRPSVQLGIAGLIATTILQAMGVVGAPVVDMGHLAATNTGTLSTLLSVGTALFGSTGGFSAVGKVFKALSGIKFGSTTTPPAA